MSKLISRIAASVATLLLSCIALATVGVANPTVGGIAADLKAIHVNDVVHVGYYKERRKYRRRAYHRRKYKRKYSRRHYRRNYRRRGHVHVDAPFTRYRRHRGRISVDAPFTSVRRGRYGVHVRAPFVDLWVPRRY
ncbi:MAG: hypothetical protein ACRBCJ_07565 [Hyphomicrobiaceae bacterium]